MWREGRENGMIKVTGILKRELYLLINLSRALMRKFFHSLENNSKKYVRAFLIFVCTLVSIITFSVLVLVSWSVGQFAQESLHYEQVIHLTELQKHLYTLQRKLSAFEGNVEDVSKKRLLLKEKEESAEELRAIELSALNIARETFAYSQDDTLKLFGVRDENSDQYFDAARDVHVYAERFVRTMENALWEQRISTQQKILLKENYNLLMKRISELL